MSRPWKYLGLRMTDQAQNDPTVWREFAAIREQVGAIVGQLSAKAGRDDLHQYKEAVFARLEVVVEKAVGEQMKLWGHEVAKVIHTEVQAEVARQLAEKEGEAAKQAVAENKKAERSGLSPRTAAFMSVGGLLIGLFLSQYAVPLLIAAARRYILGV